MSTTGPESSGLSAGSGDAEGRLRPRGGSAGQGSEKSVLVVANETVAGKSLIDSLRRHAGAEEIRVTVLCPINQPRHGSVVYEDTRRAAAGRRLDRTLAILRDAGISAHGLVVETDPVNAVRDVLQQEEVGEIVVSTHPRERSGWLRRHVVERIRDVAGDIPVEHVIASDEPSDRPANVLVIANETVVDDALLDRIRHRAQRAPASFLIVSPQSDPARGAHPEAERRLRRALAVLRGEGLDVHGQLAHPDPFTAVMHAVHDERVDEIIISTFGPERSGWLRRDLVDRVRRETGLPIEHVISARNPATEPAAV